MSDYLRVRDFFHLPEHIIALYDNRAPEGGIPHLEAARLRRPVANRPNSRRGNVPTAAPG
jgi:hypothetical protein